MIGNHGVIIVVYFLPRTSADCCLKGFSELCIEHGIYDKID